MPIDPTPDCLALCLAEFTGSVRRDIARENSAIHLFSAPSAGNIVLEVAVGEGHPEFGCDSSSTDPRCKGQENEEFDLFLNGRLIASHRDQGKDVNAWVTLEPTVAESVSGVNELVIRHTLKDGSPGSVSYRISISMPE